MKPEQKPSFSLGHLLLLTWLVMGGGMLTGLAPALAIPIAVLLSLLLIRGLVWRDPGGLSLAEDGEISSGGHLAKLVVARRRERAQARSRPAGRPGSDAHRHVDADRDLRQLLIEEVERRKGPIPVLVPIKEAAGRGARSALDLYPGVLLAIALPASLLTVLALISETSRLLQSDGGLDVFRLLDLCGVVVLPVVLGIACRYEVHSILTMIGLSAAIQTLLFQATASASAPDGVLLGMAAITLPGIPLGLAWLFCRLDRPTEDGGWCETTTGRLLESKQDRMSLRRRGRVAGRAGVRPPHDPGAAGA